MRAPDLVWSYALGTYLVEGMPDKTKRLLRELGDGTAPHVAFPRTLGYDLPTLEARLLRWLRETK